MENKEAFFGCNKKLMSLVISRTPTVGVFVFACAEFVHFFLMYALKVIGLISVCLHAH